MKLESYLEARWQSGTGDGRALVNPVTGTEIAHADTTGLNLAAAIDFARHAGVGALQSLSFAERGALLRGVADVLQTNRDAYLEIARENSGNTKADASVDIDGGIFTLKTYARLGQSLGDGVALVEAGEDQLAREPVFFSRHFWTSRPGVAVQINAFNFPSWGMWEKVAQATIAGVPSFVKPATSTALLSQRMIRDVVDAGVVPSGVLSLLCGSANGVVDCLGAMDSIAFTGSAATGQVLRRQVAGKLAPPRLTIEADSVNATIVGPDVTLGAPLFDVAVRETANALTLKAGQLCTNIRRIFVHQELVPTFEDAVADKLAKVSVGDPADDSTRVGPLVNLAQKNEAIANIGKLKTEASVVAESSLPTGLESGAFVAPTLLRCADLKNAQAVHDIEVFGPCATILPYENLDEAIALGTKAEGSLALSLFSDDRAVQEGTFLGLGPWHGRLMFVDAEVGKAHTGHAIVMPQCVHGGPGRAGGGEELGGLRGLRFHMQRSAIQGGPTALSHLVSATVETNL
jgi:3,4-dehydroadipyl-CoA semialdehyde dehydrogenase